MMMVRFPWGFDDDRWLIKTMIFLGRWYWWWWLWLDYHEGFDDDDDEDDDDNIVGDDWDDE